MPGSRPPRCSAPRPETPPGAARAVAGNCFFCDHFNVNLVHPHMSPPYYVHLIPSMSDVFIWAPESGRKTWRNRLNLASLRSAHLVWRPMPKSGQSTCRCKQIQAIYGGLRMSMEPPVRSKHPNTFKTGNHWEPLGTCRSRPCFAIC